MARDKMGKKVEEGRREAGGRGGEGEKQGAVGSWERVRGRTAEEMGSYRWENEGLQKIG